MRASFILTAAVLLTSCSGSSPADSRTTASKNTRNGAAATATVDPVTLLKQLQATDKIEVQELAGLKVINQQLCERLQKLRTECVSTYRLIKSISDADLACVSGNTNAVNAAADFEIDFQGDGRIYTLRANNFWETNTFTNGATKLVWKARKVGGSSQAPRLIDVSNLEVYPNDAGSAPALTAISKFDLKVAGTLVVSKSDLSDAQNLSGYFVVGAQKIRDLKSSAACMVNQAEIEQMIQKQLQAQIIP